MSITSVVNDLVTSVSVINALKPLPPTISGYSVGGLDDTALDPAGGQTVQINGTGFLAGATITFDGSAVAVVTYVNSNQLTFTSPAKSAGTYTIYVVNPDGGTAIYIPGIIYSVLPTWTTSAGTLGSYYETTSISNTVVASGDAPITYSLFSGSLPTGSTLYANGVITGTAPVDSSSTTYSFTIQATDAQLQDSTRSFSLTINVDAVTWVSPANATTYSSAVDSAIANVVLSATDAAGYAITYSANALPTGLSLSGANISGTPTVIADSSTLLTATAATTNRSAVRTINWSITVANDPYFEYNTLLIPGASTTFVDDASTNNFAVTINGDTKPNNTNPYTPGYYSNYFDGSGDGLSIAAGNTALSFGTGDYTVEFWVYPVVFGSVSNSAPTMVAVHDGSTDSGWQLYWNDGQIGIRTHYSNVVYWTASMASYLNTWSHVAYVRSSGTQKIYVNGIERCSTSAVWNWTDTQLQIATAAQDFNGYISNLRLVKGTALYTSAFTPPSTPLTAISGTSVLTCQSNRFIDNSTNAFTIIPRSGGNQSVKSFQPFTPNSSYSTYGSGYFDGTGDYLTVPQNVAFNFGTGDFTVEGWWNFNAFVSDQALIILGGGANGGGPFTGWWLRYQPAIGLGFSRYDGSTFTEYNFALSSALVVGAWYHIACTRSGTSLKMFVNGVAQGTTVTTSISFNNINSDPLQIGKQTTGAGISYTNAYVTDVRLVKGTAVYTTTFTPPSAPLTAIANTSLLTLQNNQSVNNSVFLDNSTNNFLVTRNGNTTQGTFSPYGGNWSNYFDGSSTAYIQTPAGSTTAILGTAGGGITPTATFTIECWIYQIQRQTALVNPVLIGDQGVNGSLYWTFGPDSSGKLAFYHYTGTTLSATGNDTIPLNTWTHIAVSISSGFIKLFVNGTLQTITGTSTTGSQAGTFGYLLTGGFYTFSGGYSYIGYLSNLRIVKSALYSTTFTPSTTPLTPITNTGLLMSQSARFIDNSPNAFALTTGSTLSVQRFSPFNPSSVTPTSYSGYFGSVNGNSLYLSAQSSGTGGVALTGDYTIEMWMYPTAASSSGYSMIVSTNTNGSYLQFGYYSDGRFTYNNLASGADNRLTAVGALTLNTWQHIALVRSSNVTKIYVGGVEKPFTTANTDSTTVYANYIGGLGTVYNTLGYISNFRITNTAVYTTTFTPSTTPLTAISGTQLLTLQSPTFIDNSTNNFTITAFGNSQPTQQNPFGYTSATTNGYTVSTIGGSGYFDGTGDTISVPFSSAISLGTSNFTMEAWCYPTTTTNGIDSIWGSGNYSIMLYHNGTSWTLEVGDGGGNYFTINGTAPIYAWNHMAVTRSGSTFNLWINGVSAGTGTTAGTMKTSGTLVIGGNGNGQNFTGYITDFRLVKGTALYTSSFVPPSAPLLAVQNTVLLNNMTSAGIYDAAMMNNMETVADAKLSTAVSKFGGSSMYFDGAGDVLKTSPGVINSLGSGDFTIEGWVYPLSLGSMRILSQGTYAAGEFLFILNSNGSADFCEATTSRLAFSAGSFVVGEWKYFAIVRSGSGSNNLKGYINGTLAGTGTSSSYNYNATTAIFVGSSPTTPNQDFQGYIDDLRITKGYARYTSNFTAPTSAFPVY